MANEIATSGFRPPHNDIGYIVNTHTFAATDQYRSRRAANGRPYDLNGNQSDKRCYFKESGFSYLQKGFYDHVIRGERDYLDVWNYIEGNPGKRKEDKLYVSDGQ